MSKIIDAPFTVAEDGPVAPGLIRGFWLTNPHRGKPRKGVMPPALARYWAHHRRGHNPGRKRNPWEQVGYPKRALKTVEFRDKSGKWKRFASGAGKPKRASNPYELAMLNPSRHNPFQVVHKVVRVKGRKRNPMAAAGASGFKGFVSSLTSWRGVSVVGTAVTAATVDRQLVPRAMMLLPAGGVFDWFKRGIGYLLARLVFALVPAGLIYRFGSKTYGLAYGAGGVASVGVSALEYGLNTAGVPTMGESAGTVIPQQGNPMGALAEFFGGYSGRRAGAPDQVVQQTVAEYGDRQPVGDVADDGVAEGGGEPEIAG